MRTQDTRKMHWREREFDGYVLEYKALLISIGTRILEASQQKLPRNFVNLIIRNV